MNGRQLQAQRFSSSRTRSIGIASAVPFAERTLVAWKRELYTASSVASSAASKSGEVASGGSIVRPRGAVSLKRLRISGAVENAIAKSPLPLLYDDPVRARPNTARAASRRKSRASSGASVATTSMQDPSPLGSTDSTFARGRPLDSADSAPDRGRPSAAAARRGGCRDLKIGTPAIVRFPPKLVCARTPTV